MPTTQAVSIIIARLIPLDKGLGKIINRSVNTHTLNSEDESSISRHSFQVFLALRLGAIVSPEIPTV